MANGTWTERHPDLWQFIKFNILSNISTITRFVFAWLFTLLFVNQLAMTEPFSFLIFDYTGASSNGLGGFLTFLCAEVVAQTVNFFVQLKLVFNTDQDMRDVIWKYIVLAIVLVVASLVLPGHVSNLCIGALGLDAGAASLVASAVNTLVAVLICWPMLKFWVMPDAKGKGPQAQQAA